MAADRKLITQQSTKNGRKQWSRVCRRGVTGGKRGWGVVLPYFARDKLKGSRNYK